MRDLENMLAGKDHDGAFNARRLTIDLTGGTSSRPTSPEPLEYFNPLEAHSRWYLMARAQAIRYAAHLGFSIANRADPPAPSPTRTDLWLDSTLSERSGSRKIKVETWIPPRPPAGLRPAVICFHGGGWILGSGTDDARWCGAVMTELDAIVFTVNYRLSPHYPFPIPVEDCVDAVLQISARAEEFGVDPEKIILSGFSAGATNALSAWNILKEPIRWSYKFAHPPPKILGLTLFYPLLDWTTTRPEKRQTCRRPELTLSKGLTDLFDASYVYPPIPRDQRTDPRLSPGLMDETLLRKDLPPVHLVMCEYDMLLAEQMTFAKRLENCSKNYTFSVVHGEKHAWDKPPGARLDVVNTEYELATGSMAKWLGIKREPDTLSMTSMRKKRPRLRKPKSTIFRSRSARPS